MSKWNPKPPNPPVPEVKSVHVVCHGPNGVILPTGGSLLLDQGSVMVSGVVVAPQIHFNLPVGHGYGNGAYISLTGIDGYKIETHDPAGSTRLVTAPDVNLDLIPEIVTVYPPALEIDGIFFKAGGAPIGVIEATSFRLYKNYLDGADTSAVLNQLRALGFNFVRVFGMCKNMFDFDPSTYGAAYYGRLPEFIKYVASYGIYTEFTVFPDVNIIRNNQQWQKDHWAEVCRSLSSVAGWVLLEAQNEVDQSPNVMDLSILDHPSNLISCMGTYGGSYDIPPRPWKRYESIHLNGQSEWQRKPKSAMEKSLGAAGGPENPAGVPASNVPCTVNELNRFPDQDGNANHYEDAAGVAALLCAGICFHYPSGKQSLPMNGSEVPGASAFVKGFKAVPLHIRYGSYYRPENTGPYLRIYGKVLGGERYEVNVRY